MSFDQQQQQSYGIQQAPAPTEYDFSISSPTLGTYNLKLSHQSNLATLYQKIQERYRVDDAYLKYNDYRLPNNQSLISQYISSSVAGTIVLDLVTTSIDDVLTLKYMCEKCGHIVCFLATSATLLCCCHFSPFCFPPNFFCPFAVKFHQTPPQPLFAGQGS